MTRRSLGHRAPLLWLVLPFMGGLVAAQTFGLVSARAWLGIALATAVGAVFATTRATWLWRGAVVLSMVFAGMGSYALHRARLLGRSQLRHRTRRPHYQAGHTQSYRPGA